MQSARYAIYCFANRSIVFAGRAWLFYRASCWSSANVEVCRAISSYCPLKSAIYSSRALERFGWRTKEPLAALSIRNIAIKVHFQVDCRVVLPSCWPMYAKLRRIRSNGVLYSATLTGTSSLATLWNRNVVENWSTKSHLLRTWSRSQTPACRNMKDLERGSQKYNWTMGVNELWLYELKIKIPAIYSRRLSVLYLFRNVPIFEAWEGKENEKDTKTRWNRARDFSNPLIRHIPVPF